MWIAIKIFRYCPAFKNIIQSLSESHRKLAVVNYGEDTKIVNSLIFNNLSNLIHPLKVMNSNDSTSLLVRESAVIIFDSVNQLSEFNRNCKLNNTYPVSLQFFVYCRGATFSDLAKLKYSACCCDNHDLDPKLCDSKCQKLCFRKKRRTTTLNVFKIISGISQFRPPGRNFVRFM